MTENVLGSFLRRAFELVISVAFVDIPECARNQHNCDSEDHCRETSGSFECFCPDGLIGNGTKEGGGCHREQKPDPFTKIIIGKQITISFQFCFSYLRQLIFLITQTR